MRSIDYTVTEYFDGKKIFNFLRGYVKISVRLLRSLKTVEDGIMLNGKRARTIDIIHTGDKVTINIPDDSTMSIPIDYPLDIVYEDDDLLIINKPPMLPMHESHNHQGDTLANAVAGYLIKKDKPATFRAIGRLDKGTSGIVVCALNSHVAARLSGKIKKQYLALVTARYDEDGTINKPVYRPDPMKTFRTADDRGDYAVTHYHVEEKGDNYSLMRIDLETGRTHQIRVHFAYLGTPLYGDRMYGTEDDRICHQALHCENLTFIHPVTNEEFTVKAEMPEDMKELLKDLRE
ncbi:MAG: RluA family pseudouridine synthase [Acutalibacteraceae bacterium]|nr:RluA family pseudouridine synthase [Acutalibacteraceae bacterium]